MKDCTIEIQTEYMKTLGIKAIYKYLNQIVVVFEQEVKSIKGKENQIINKINSHFN